MNDYQFLIPVITSLIAIVLTGYQQFIANKQFLFDKRLFVYRKYKTLLSHQKDAQLYFQDKSPNDFCAHDMLIGTLTNDTELAQAAKKWNDRNDADSLMKTKGHKAFLSMIETIRSYGIESSFVFRCKYGNILNDYFNKYADLCFITYQYSTLMRCIQNENKKLNVTNSVMPSATARDRQMPLHAELNQIYADLCKLSDLIKISDLEKSISFIRR